MSHEHMMWKEIHVTPSHKKWDEVFSKVIKHPKLQYTEGMDRTEVKIKLTERQHKSVKDVHYKVIADHQSEEQSMLTFLKKVA